LEVERGEKVRIATKLQLWKAFGNM